jgi:hypothetical protein
MRTKLALIAACILLSGGATYWHHADKAQAGFDQDHASCEYDVLIERHRASVYSLEVHQLVERCLEIKGWVGPYAEEQPGYSMSVGS